MKISWQISDSDVQQVKIFLKEQDNKFTRKRELKNIQKEQIVLDKDSVIKTMIMCLLTSQQRSGPNSKVNIFLDQPVFPITESSLEEVGNIEEHIKETLLKFGLTRFINNISKHFAFNFNKIEEENWEIIPELIALNDEDSQSKEQTLADALAEKFKGFGPKQSRNFLQALGVTKYEIPIDSRITNWLNEFGFPIKLTSKPLSDRNYYHFISDGIQELCKKANVYPCLLDAAIFSSFDNDGWN